MQIRKRSMADFCLCDHEKNNNLPRTQYCIFVCPTKGKELLAPFLKRFKEKKLMKEKLLKLIQACIQDETMYEHTYHGEKGQEYRGLNEGLSNSRISYVPRIEYNGKNAQYIAGFGCDLNPYNKYKEGYRLVVGFGNEPQISITPILKGNGKTFTEKTLKINGVRDNFFGRKRQTVFDVTVRSEEYHYELRCGSYAFIVDEEVIKDFYDQITQKRKDKVIKIELHEINSRFDKYYIK